MHISAVPVFECAHIIPGNFSASAPSAQRIKRTGPKCVAGALFSPCLSAVKRLRGKEQIFDSKCHSTSLQILHVLAPCCWAVVCGVVCPCLNPGLSLSLGHEEFCHAPIALNTSEMEMSAWLRGQTRTTESGVVSVTSGGRDSEG